MRLSRDQFRIEGRLHTRWKVSKPVRIALYLVESLLVLALAALIVMSSAWFQHVLERQVIAGLEDLTGGRVEIGHFRFRPWLFQITLRKLGDPRLGSRRRSTPDFSARCGSRSEPRATLAPAASPAPLGHR